MQNRDRPLRAIGFWREELELLPHPRWLVRPAWRRTDRLRIGAYLRSGAKLASYLGYSWCRFRCGIDDSMLGTSDLTDGIWVWPEGLAHYVEVHSIRLPDEFVATMQENSWHVPTSVPTVTHRVDHGYDFMYWQKWVFRRFGILCWL